MMDTIYLIITCTILGWNIKTLVDLRVWEV